MSVTGYKRNAIFVTVLMLLIIATAGCNFSGGSGGSGQASLFLTDAPSNDLKEVNVTIKEVQAHRDGRWEVINTFASGLKINLLELRFDETLLGTATLPAGAYTQLRLILDDSDAATSNVIDQSDTVWPLKVPSGYQTGLKIQHAFTVPAGGTVALVLDANVLDFVHLTGNGTYMMSPTAIRVVEKVTTGIVSGRVLDSASQAAITGTDVFVALRLDANGDGQPDDVSGDGVYSPDTDYVAQTVALRESFVDDNGTTHDAGEFQLNAVPDLQEGSYIVEVTASGYTTWTQTGLNVTAGEETQIDGDPSTAATIDPIQLAQATP